MNAEDIYRKLGVPAAVNAVGTGTLVGGSGPPDFVREAMEAASGRFVRMNDLLRACGDAIAAQVGTEAAYVSCGGAAGVTLSAAACIAGTDPAAIRHLPDAEGLRNEIVVQKRHSDSYDRCLRAAGARLVEVGREDGCDAGELEAGITGDTVAIWYPWPPMGDQTGLYPEMPGPGRDRPAGGGARHRQATRRARDRRRRLGHLPPRPHAPDRRRRRPGDLRRQVLRRPQRQRLRVRRPRPDRGGRRAGLHHAGRRHGDRPLHETGPPAGDRPDGRRRALVRHRPRRPLRRHRPQAGRGRAGAARSPTRPARPSHGHPRLLRLVPGRRAGYRGARQDGGADRRGAVRRRALGAGAVAHRVHAVGVLLHRRGRRGAGSSPTGCAPCCNDPHLHGVGGPLRQLPAAHRPARNRLRRPWLSAPSTGCPHSRSASARSAWTPAACSCRT